MVSEAPVLTTSISNPSLINDYYFLFVIKRLVRIDIINYE